MHYSDCNCRLGNRRQDLCYQYTIGKDTGYGVLGATLGVITSVALYVLYMYRCLAERLSAGSNKGDNLHGLLNNKVGPENDKPEVKDYSDRKPSDIAEEPKPHGRQHKCWACDVKRKITDAPVWYRQEVRTYMDGTVSSVLKTKQFD